ncbi:MAG: hypothetical protein IPQ08_09210 [Chitinophagaceae bacterium]|nr:hypothetical protein [Chitinophagaceae bacterium]
MKKIANRLNRPTPRFFQKIRNVAVAAAAVGAAILAAPVGMPAILLKIAGYLTVAGSVAGGVSQAAVTNEEE